MGQLIEFPKRTDPDSRTENPAEIRGPVQKGKGAEVLFFTGVRYERAVSLPSDRLKTPNVKR